MHTSIHPSTQGSAYSGHYHAYLRDTLGEGRWQKPSQKRPGEQGDDDDDDAAAPGPAPIVVPECLLGQPDAEPVACVAGIVAGEGGSVKMGALGRKVKERLFKPWGNLFRERFGASFAQLDLACVCMHVCCTHAPPPPPPDAPSTTTPTPPPPPPPKTGTMDLFRQERPQYFRYDRQTDTVHLRHNAFPPRAFDAGAGVAAAAAAEGGAGLGGSGGKW